MGNVQIWTRRQNAIQPRKKLSKLNVGIDINLFTNVPSIKVLEKLVFLFNHLIQHYVVNYKETILRQVSKNNHTTDIIMFMNVQPLVHADLVYIDNIITTYLDKGIINKQQMQRANIIWEKLKESSELYKTSNAI